MLAIHRLALIAGLSGFVAPQVSGADLPALTGPSAPPSAGPTNAPPSLPAQPIQTAQPAQPNGGTSPLACCPEVLTTRCPGDPQHWWASADYMFGWINGVSTQPFVAAAPASGGVPTSLVSGDNINGGFRNGFQVRGGFWLNDCGTCGIDLGMLYLGALAQRSQVGDTPGYVVGRPFLNALTNAPDAQIINVPGLVSGRVTVDAVSSDFWGADVAFRKLVCCDCNGRLDWLVGYRFLSYGDSVRINEDLQPLPPTFPPGTRIGVSDAFTAQNEFHGALFALAGEYRLGSWFVQGRGGVSIGSTFRRATISGSTTVEVPPGPPVTAPGGLLALSSNSGTFSSSEWVFLPEASVRLGYQVTSNLRLYGGYSFLYWPGVYRAADQIDPVINPGLLPPPIAAGGPIRPLFPNRQSSLWVHGASFGVELRY